MPAFPSVSTWQKQRMHAELFSELECACCLQALVQLLGMDDVGWPQLIPR
jgi:hypothetical protein